MQTDNRPTYGSVAGEYQLDEQGSKVRITEHYIKGILNDKVKKEYKVRRKVKNQKEEHEVYYDFSNRLANDNGMLDPAFMLEPKRLGGTDTGYYVVEHYTRIEPLIPDTTMSTVVDFEKARMQ